MTDIQERLSIKIYDLLKDSSKKITEEEIRHELIEFLTEVLPPVTVQIKSFNVKTGNVNIEIK
tara:strand:- start:51907 stop:52095 length:189 start_codon:yes stop_codon:yes gene_type:complete